MATFEKIATATVGSGGASSITFDPIAASWTDLVILASVRTTGGSTSDQMLIKFNGSTSGYSSKMLGGNGSSTSSPAIAQYVMPNNTTDQTASTFNNGQIYIPNYTGSSNKSYSAEGVQENNGTAAFMWMTAGLWSNTAAITSIELYPTANTFAQYSTATLYGIKKA